MKEALLDDRRHQAIRQEEQRTPKRWGVSWDGEPEHLHPLMSSTRNQEAASEKRRNRGEEENWSPGSGVGHPIASS